MQEEDKEDKDDTKAKTPSKPKGPRKRNKKFCRPELSQVFNLLTIPPPPPTKAEHPQEEKPKENRTSTKSRKKKKRTMGPTREDDGKKTGPNDDVPPPSQAFNNIALRSNPLFMMAQAVAIANEREKKKRREGVNVNARVPISEMPNNRGDEPTNEERSPRLWSGMEPPTSSAILPTDDKETVFREMEPAGTSAEHEDIPGGFANDMYASLPSTNNTLWTESLLLGGSFDESEDAPSYELPEQQEQNEASVAWSGPTSEQASLPLSSTASDWFVNTGETFAGRPPGLANAQVTMQTQPSSVPPYFASTLNLQPRLFPIHNEMTKIVQPPALLRRGRTQLFLPPPGIKAATMRKAPLRLPPSGVSSHRQGFQPPLLRKQQHVLPPRKRKAARRARLGEKRKEPEGTVKNDTADLLLPNAVLPSPLWDDTTSCFDSSPPPTLKLDIDKETEPPPKRQKEAVEETSTSEDDKVQDEETTSWDDINSDMTVTMEAPDSTITFLGEDINGSNPAPPTFDDETGLNAETEDEL